MTYDLTSAKAAAADFRRQQHLGTGPIADIVTMLEGVPRIHVAIEPGSDGDHHGMRATDPVRGVTVLGACATPHAVRLRSTLAHELGHHIFNDPTPEDWSRRTLEEDRATEFARHLLIPVEALVDLLGRPGHVDVNEVALSDVVERFAVSPAMAAIQLRDSGYVDTATAERFMALSTPTLATRHGWAALYRQWSEASRTLRPPQRVVAAAVNAYIARQATLATVANLRGATPEQTRAELGEAGVHPAPTGGVHAEREDGDTQGIYDEGDEVDWSALDAVDGLPADTEDDRR